MSKTANKKMGQELSEYLPSELKFEILTRLPARTVVRFKSVCKPWLHLFATPEFIKSHISKSVPGLAVSVSLEGERKYKVLEFVDELDLKPHLNTVFDFELPFQAQVHSSVHGLLFLFTLGIFKYDLYISNPITREYLKLPSPLPSSCDPCALSQQAFGFGVSRMSGQYKVVKIFPTGIRLRRCGGKCEKLECQVYTVGSGSWRGIACATPTPLNYEVGAVGEFLKGNLHWLANSGSSVHISCLDLETELFRIFSPPLDAPNACRKLLVLRDYLCVCDNSFGLDINIWVMKKYGYNTSWTKDFIIFKANRNRVLGFRYPIKIFKDGDVLIRSDSGKLLHYSSKTKTMREINLSGMDPSTVSFSSAAIYAPSLLSLKAFEMEEVRSF